MVKKETAEQKLLRIIEEGARDSGEPVGKISAASATASATARDMAAAVRGPSIGMPLVHINVSGFLSKLQAVVPIGKPFGLRQANMILSILIIACIAVLIMIYQKESSRLKKDFAFSKTDSLTKSFGQSAMPIYASANRFLDVILQRNLFRPYEEKVVEPGLAGPSDMIRIGAKLQKFKLVGISWLDSPDTASVMIEQIDTGITYFLRQGESFDELKVHKIYADRVIFGFKNEEMEVRL